MKKIYTLVSIIIISAILNIFFYTSNIVDISTGEQLNNIILQWPVFRLFIEPFYAFAYYILTMERTGYVFALISWLSWLVLITVILCRYNGVKLKNTIISCCFSFFFFVSLCCMVVILPVIGPKITNINGYKIADIHSHTISSRDNISSMLSSINFHKEHGFSDFFVTEHDNTNGYKTIPNDIGTEHIFPGIQIRTKDGVSVLLLSKDYFEYEDFRDKSIKDLIDLCHLRDMLVVMPHWWKWHKPDLQQLVDWKIDGFEIYNCGYRYISDQTRQEIIDICNKNNLPMFGTTDWHGLGYMTNVWTLIKEKDNKNIFELIKDKSKTKVVVHDVKGNQSYLRYVFEPFYFMYLYVTTTQLKYVVSFYMFILVLIGLFYNVPVMRIIRLCSLLLALFFSGSVFHFVYMLEYSFCNNVMIPETIIPTAAALVFIWFIIWGFCDKDI
ncbi:MAG: hypothetical protein J6U02_03495 [Elusimicrobia bacterium]|jgi:predicted metal-dependent phosphoesterase TrpH|nr:hypothetical protein [Elusimicrobiota bacterium]